MTLYVMCGCPGSGKTTWAKKNLPQAIYVSTDEIRMELFGTYEPGLDEKAVFQQFYGRIRQALREGHDVVADATNLTKTRRKKALDCLSEQDEAVAVVLYTPLSVAVVLYTPLSVALQRNASRDRQVPESAVQRMHYILSSSLPRRSEGFREVRMIGVSEGVFHSPKNK